MKQLYLGLIMILLAGVACGPVTTVDDTPVLTPIVETGTPRNTLSPVTPSATPSQTPSSTPHVSESQISPDIVVTYHRSGGFAGLEQEWTFYSDGRVELPDGSQKQVEATRAQTLFDAVQTADFQSLDESYVPKDTCCDRFTHVVTVQTADESQTVTTLDDSPNEPAVLTAVLQTINELIQTIE